MKYKEKIKYAEAAATKIMENNYSEEQIRKELKQEGLFERDIDNILVSTKNIIGEKLKPLIQQKLLAKEPIQGAVEFEKIEPDLLKKLTKLEFKNIADGEKRKVSKLLRAKTPTEEILSQVNLDFYPEAAVVSQIAAFTEVKKRNSIGGRMIMILSGIGIMALGAGLSYASMSDDGSMRVFYGLIIGGLIVAVKGFFTEENPY